MPPRLTNVTAINNAEIGWMSLWAGLDVGRTYSIRKRFTIAEINAGATLLPALINYKYRMIGAGMISVGGAVGAATTVDILGTRDAVAVKLVAAAIATLTENALVRDATANILAAGASYTALDSGTAVTVGKTGSTATTATHVDVIFTFAVDEA